MNNVITATNTSLQPSIDIEELKRKGKIFRENAGATILDIGDRVALVEFHTKANSLNDSITEMLSIAINEGIEKFNAIVIGNRGRHFSAGANLSMLLDSAQNGKWNQMERTMRQLQDTNMLLKYGPVPVVAAPFSSTLGGGCEIVLHSSRVVAAEELHMGLVEAGVGLIPAGGGTKELALRALIPIADNGSSDLLSSLQKVFSTILSAYVTKSGTEAKEIFLSAEDQVVLSSASLIETAKQVALELVNSGFYSEGPTTTIPVMGTSGMTIFQTHIADMLRAKVISEHDAVIATHIARVLCGGNVTSPTASEQHFLDLEREAFLSLLGTQKTQERIEYLLKNNKPLHN